MRVLIADDDAVSRKGLYGLTRSWGYDPVLARDGFERTRKAIYCT